MVLPNHATDLDLVDRFQKRPRWRKPAGTANQPPANPAGESHQPPVKFEMRWQSSDFIGTARALWMPLFCESKIFTFAVQRSRVPPASDKSRLPARSKPQKENQCQEN